MGFAEYLEEIRSAAHRLPETLLVYEYLPSTNLEARKLLGRLPADTYPVPPFVVLAHRQTAGRGRHGRLWQSPPGGLYGSWVVPLADAAPPRILPLVAAVAACRAVRAVGVTACGLKWPNDLMVAGRKVGGILIEVATPRRDKPPTAVIGCGINVDSDGSDLAGLAATTVADEASSPVAFGELFVDLTQRIADGLEWLDRPELAAEAYSELLIHKPGDRLGWSRGGERLEGTFVGIDPLGGLRLETARGEHVVSAGEVIEA